MATEGEFWNRKTFCVITGASRGIGRCIAVHFSQHLAPGSVMLLMSRNETGLKETKATILQKQSNVSVHMTPVDLGTQNTESFGKIISESLSSKSSDFEVALIVHNAGSIGDLNVKASEYETGFLKKYFDDNLISTISLNTAFLKHFSDSNAQKVLINITSLFGIQPTKGFGAYCTGKAARNMIFKVMAEENPSYLVLNYAPGPVDTAMLNSLMEAEDETIRNMPKGLREAGLILTCDQTVTKLVRIMEERKFKSGQHVDYLDDI